MGWGQRAHFPEFLLKCQLLNCVVSDEISTLIEKISTCFWAVHSLIELWLFLCICLCFSSPPSSLFVFLPSVLADIFFFSHSCSELNYFFFSCHCEHREQSTAVLITCLLLEDCYASVPDSSLFLFLSFIFVSLNEPSSFNLSLSALFP